MESDHLTHKVNFTTKNVDRGDPDYKLLIERTERFNTFTAALKFIRELKIRAGSKEILIGRPIMEEAA
jgi:hypothetical protein